MASPRSGQSLSARNGMEGNPYGPNGRTALPEYGGLPMRMVSRIDASGDCWEWTGSTAGGYGMSTWAGRRQPAHRALWSALVGPVDSSLDLDHLCRNRLCVNPDHLEPVTRSVNARRGQTGGRLGNRTHCKHGHAFTWANTRIDKYGVRRCRACSRNATRAFRARRDSSQGR